MQKYLFKGVVANMLANALINARYGHSLTQNSQSNRLFQTARFYQLFNGKYLLQAFGMFICTIFFKNFKTASMIGYGLFTTSSLLFCGGLYSKGVNGPRFGMLIPLGGLSMIAGIISLFFVF